MIENTFPYSDKIRDYSFISHKLFDVTTVSLVLTLSYFSLLDIDRFCFGNRSRRLWFVSKKKKLLKQNFLLKLEVHCISSTVEAVENAHRKVSTSNDQR